MNKIKIFLVFGEVKLKGDSLMGACPLKVQKLILQN